MSRLRASAIKKGRKEEGRKMGAEKERLPEPQVLAGHEVKEMLDTSPVPGTLRKCCDTVVPGPHLGTCSNSVMSSGEVRLWATEEPRKAKQVIIIRKDLGMRRGKEIAQGAHASMAWLANRVRLGKLEKARFAHHILLSEAEQAWLDGSFTKVTCQVSSESELRVIYDAAWQAGVRAELITDAGKTEFGGVPTLTALAVGPDWDDRVDSVTKNLKLY